MSVTVRPIVVPCGLILFSLLAVVPRSLPGQQPERKRDQAVTSPEEADSDFRIQGEYLDQVRLPDGRLAYMGLQVIALGDGRFDGMVYPGGLPGAGWNRSHKSAVQGETAGSLTELQGDEYLVSIDSAGDSAQLHTVGGERLGALGKIHRISPTQGLAPPPGAIVLFDGSQPTQLDGAKLTTDGLLMVGCATKFPVQDFRLHLEFRTPYMPCALGQRRGNSGVYIQQRYEVQILDSFGLEGLHNECGGLYRQTPPDLNMCLPPLSWQTYDIHFTAPRWDAAGNKRHNARLTVYLNGEAIHDNREVTAKTGAGKPEGPQPLPIVFQNHSDPVHFRNLWIVLRDAPATVPSPAAGAAPSVCQPLPDCGPTRQWRAPVCRPRCRLLRW
ncbi:MAG: DUF1080 domain-containing protein [Pirellulaceae bacterium]|nr:DUF1080 domain-containing protein [Pirellulaceae bacterium]